MAAATATTAPVPAIKRLPDPLDKRTRQLLARAQPPEKPDMHGCVYDDGCPWAICYACEYERSPARYQERIRRSVNIEMISAYFRNVSAGAAAGAWPSTAGLGGSDPRSASAGGGDSDWLLDAIVAELDKPRAERTYTDEQLADTKLVAEPGSLLAGLRVLLAFV
jgi:hypothetical protein